jgi:hypothetical protein
VLAALLITSHSLAAHPLHTSLAELVYDPVAKEIRISVRVFVDDLTKASEAYARAKSAAGRASGGPRPAESPVLAYARASFLVTDRAGRPLSLASCGAKIIGDLMWLCFHTPAPAGPAGFRVMHRILFDLYADQINIVQASYGGKKSSLLFTRGDGFRRLE